MAALLYRLGRFSARRHWRVIISWLVIIALAGIGYALFAGTLSPTVSIPGTATQEVQDELTEKFPKASGGSGTLVFATDDGSAFTTEEQSEIASFLDRIGSEDGVKATTDPFVTQAQLDDQRQQIVDGRQQLQDGRARLIAAQEQLDAGQAQLTAGQQQLDAARARPRPPDGSRRRGPARRPAGAARRAAGAAHRRAGPDRREHAILETQTRSSSTARSCWTWRRTSASSPRTAPRRSPPCSSPCR